MQAAIRDVKRKFLPQMQIAITPFLPGIYRLNTYTRTGGKAAAVWRYDNQTQGMRLSLGQRQQVLYWQRSPTRGAELQAGGQKVGHTGADLHWCGQRGSLEHGQAGVLAEHGT